MNRGRCLSSNSYKRREIPKNLPTVVRECSRKFLNIKAKKREYLSPGRKKLNQITAGSGGVLPLDTLCCLMENWSISPNSGSGGFTPQDPKVSGRKLKNIGISVQ